MSLIVSVPDRLGRRLRVVHVLGHVRVFPEQRLKENHNQLPSTENTHLTGKDHCMAGLQFN